MRSAQIFVLAALVLPLSGCAGTISPESLGSHITEIPIETSPAPSASATPLVEAVDPASFALVGGSGLGGVAFAVGSTGITCAINGSDSSATPYGDAGCVSTNQAFAFPEVPAAGGTTPATAIALRGGAAEPRWVSDARYEDDGSNTGIHATLTSGQSVSWGGVTCEVHDETVTCTDTTSEHGFDYSNATYTVF